MSTPLKHKTLFLLSLVTFEFSVYVSNDMILPALNQLYSDFHEPLKNLPLSLSFFLGGAVLLQLFVGALSDRFGRRTTMFLGSFVTLLGNFLAAIAPTIHFYYVARGFQGMGLCFISVAGYACVHEIFETKEAVRNIAWMSSVSLLAPMIGPLCGSGILIFGKWNDIFWVTLGFAFISSVGLYFSMPESLPINKCVPLHIFNQIKSYMGLLKNKNFFFAGLSYSCIFGALMIWISSSPLYLMKNQESPTIFALLQIPIFLAFILGNFFLRYLTFRYSVLKCYNIGYFILFVSAFVMLFSGFFASHLTIAMIFAMSIYNFGYGVMGSPNYRLILESTQTLKGTASAFNGFTVFLISSLCPVFFSWIYHVSSGSSFAFLGSIAALLFLGCAFRYFFVRFRTG